MSYGVRYVDVVYEVGRGCVGFYRECAGLEAECLRIAGSVGLFCVLYIIRYTMRRCVAVWRFLFLTLWLSYGCDVTRDALSRFVTFCYVLV